MHIDALVRSCVQEWAPVTARTDNVETAATSAIAAAAGSVENGVSPGEAEGNPPILSQVLQFEDAQETADLRDELEKICDSLQSDLPEIPLPKPPSPQVLVDRRESSQSLTTSPSSGTGKPSLVVDGPVGKPLPAAPPSSPSLVMDKTKVKKLLQWAKSFQDKIRANYMVGGLIFGQ